MNPLTYLQESIAQARLVSWPNRTTLIQLSVVVISISLTIAIILGGFDYLLTNGIGLLTTRSSGPSAPPSLQIEAPISTPSVIQSPTPAAVKKNK